MSLKHLIRDFSHGKTMNNRKTEEDTEKPREQWKMIWNFGYVSETDLVGTIYVIKVRV